MVFLHQLNRKLPHALKMFNDNHHLNIYIQILNETGLRNDDPRLKEMQDNFHDVEQKQLHDEHELRGAITRDTFKE
jgi:hypothetical protein